MSEEAVGKPEGKPKKKYPPGKHPNTLANLKPAWTSETAPRNGGRPKGSRSLPHLMRDVLNQEHNGKQLAHALAERIVKDALKGDTAKIKIILEYIEGRPKDKIELSGPDGEDIKIDLFSQVEKLTEFYERRRIEQESSDTPPNNS